MKLHKTAINIAVHSDVQAGLDALAERERTSRSWLADRLLREGLAARDALPPPAAAKIITDGVSA